MTELTDYRDVLSCVVACVSVSHFAPNIWANVIPSPIFRSSNFPSSPVVDVVIIATPNSSGIDLLAPREKSTTGQIFVGRGASLIEVH
jgi:hypothetical protein